MKKDFLSWVNPLKIFRQCRIFQMRQQICSRSWVWSACTRLIHIAILLISFTVLAATDSDNDGLTDADELAIGTDPNNPDTDSDGFQDGSEVATDSDPLSPQDTPIYRSFSSSDGNLGDAFGVSFDVDGDWAVVGARFDDDLASQSGSAYIFQNIDGSWVERAKLLPSDGAADDYFGWAVAISGNVVVVSSHNDDDYGNNSGAAYIFELTNNTWTEIQKITANDAEPFDEFGLSLDISQSSIAVGADNHNVGAGAVYIFSKVDNSWQQTQKLVPRDAENNDFFGRDVAIDKNRLVISAYGKTVNDIDWVGAVYVFEYWFDRWIENAILTPSDTPEQGFFGISVAVHDDTIVVGAPSNSHNTGSAYVYQNDGVQWHEQAILSPSSLLAGDEFGAAVGIFGDILVVTTQSINFPGAAYVYGRAGQSWSLQSAFTPNDITANGFFGSAVQVLENNFLVGAVRNSIPPNAGSVYSFYEIDRDEDGLINGFETLIGTDPDIYDTDSDSLLDGFEVNYSFDPLVGGEATLDPDGDGESNFSEQLRNSNPHLPDTDNDGLPDSVESNTGIYISPSDTGTNPNKRDSDGDQLTDDVETNTGTHVSVSNTGTNPILPDTDNDSLFDGFEVLNSLDALMQNDSGFDPDQDTLPNIDEQRLLTDPNNADTDEDGFSDNAETDTGSFIDFNDTGTSPIYFDTDKDGFSDGEEFALHADPLDWTDSPVHRKLLTPAPAYFSTQLSVAVGDNFAIVGVPNDDDNGVDSGALYVYEKTPENRWNFAYKLYASDAAVGALFGSDITLRGNEIVACASEAQNAYIFTESAGIWSELQIISSVSAPASEEFCTAVEMSDDTIVIGAPGEVGAVYVYEKIGEVWSQVSLSVILCFEPYYPAMGRRAVWQKQEKPRRLTPIS